MLAPSDFSTTGLKKYFANTSWMVLEKSGSFSLNLIVALLVARALGPGDFGLLQYALSVVGLFSLITTLGLDVVLTQELVRHPEGSGKLLGTAFALRSVAVMVMLGILVATVVLAGYDARLRLMIVTLGLAQFPQVFGTLELYFHARVLARISAAANFVATLAGAVLAVVQLALHAQVQYFTGIWLLDAIVLAIALWIGYRRTPNRPSRWTFDAAIAKSMLRKGWPLMFSTALVSIYTNTDRVMVRAALGDQATGFYAAATRLSEAWYIVPTVIVNSLFPAVISAKEMSTARYHHRLQQLYDLMVWIAVAVAIPVSMFSHRLISFLYGTEFGPAATVLSIQVWTGVLVFLGVASGRWFVLEGHTIGYLLRTLLGVGCNIAFNWLLIPIYGIQGAALATLFAQVAVVLMFDAVGKTTRVSFLMKCHALVPIHWMHYGAGGRDAN